MIACFATTSGVAVSVSTPLFSCTAPKLAGGRLANVAVGLSPGSVIPRSLRKRLTLSLPPLDTVSASSTATGGGLTGTGSATVTMILPVAV